MLYRSILSALVISCLSNNVLAKPVKREVIGPVMPYNFPDPCIIKTGGWWYSFATNSGGINVQIARSRDFYTWDLVRNPDGTQADALPNPSTWVNMTATHVWAPDVVQLVRFFPSCFENSIDFYQDDGTFVMYYSAVTMVNVRVSSPLIASDFTNP